MDNFTEILNDGATLRLKLTNGTYKSISKTGARVTVGEDIATVFVIDNIGMAYSNLYTNVSSPSAASADALRVIIEGYLDSSGGVASDVNVLTLPTAVVAGDIAHDSPDSGAPVKIGHKAVAHGSNPTAVAAGDRTDSYSNRHGIPFVISGHMNAKTVEYMATSAQTNDPIIDSIGAGSKIVVTEIVASTDNATTVDVGVRIGFGSASVPAEPSDGGSVDGVILSHAGIPPGSGIGRGTGAGIIGIGGDGEELRITNEVPTTGKLRVVVTYFTIES